MILDFYVRSRLQAYLYLNIGIGPMVRTNFFNGFEYCEVLSLECLYSALQ